MSKTSKGAKINLGTSILAMLLGFAGYGALSPVVMQTGEVLSTAVDRMDTPEGQLDPSSCLPLVVDASSARESSPEHDDSATASRERADPCPGGG